MGQSWPLDVSIVTRLLSMAVQWGPSLTMQKKIAAVVLDTRNHVYLKFLLESQIPTAYNLFW